MSDKRPPDFSKDEIRIITATLKERYGHDIEVQQADAEIRLNRAIPELTECPILFWEVGDCHFLIARADKHHFINHFYYRLYQTYGTEKKRYDDLFDCIVSLLKSQQEYEEKERDLPKKN